MQYFPREDVDDFSGATLIASTVSVGNVGQLATEILSSTLGASLVGYFSTPNVVPCVGYDPFGQGDSTTLALNLELYKIKDGNTFLLQQRAPAVAGRQRAFAEEIVNWVTENAFGQVVIVGSLEAAWRRDAQILDPQIRFVCAWSGWKDRLVGLGLKELEDEELFDREESERRVPPWPLISKCREAGVHACALLAFVNEGDNVVDAIEVGKCVVGLMDTGGEEVGVRDWKLPPALRLMYGRPVEGFV